MTTHVSCELMLEKVGLKTTCNMQKSGAQRKQKTPSLTGLVRFSDSWPACGVFVPSGSKDFQVLQPYPRISFIIASRTDSGEYSFKVECSIHPGSGIRSGIPVLLLVVSAIPTEKNLAEYPE